VIRPLPPLIGLIGYKRSGKNTVADVLVDCFGYRSIAFADPLREAVRALDPLVGRFPLPGQLSAPSDGWRLSEVLDAIGYEKAKEIPEVRRTYQRFGTDSIRALDPGFWLRLGEQRIDELRDATLRHEQGMFDAVESPVAVTDARFPNEADTIRARGGYIVRVVRPGFEPEAGAHTSETALDGYGEDFVVDNSRDLNFVAEQTLTIARMVRELTRAGIHGPLNE
jgi:hypothetical protein